MGTSPKKRRGRRKKNERTFPQTHLDVIIIIIVILNAETSPCDYCFNRFFQRFQVKPRWILFPSARNLLQVMHNFRSQIFCAFTQCSSAQTSISNGCIVASFGFTLCLGKCGVLIKADRVFPKGQKTQDQKRVTRIWKLLLAHGLTH